MALISFEHKGNFSATEKFLMKLRHTNVEQILEKYGQMGVEALAAATPVKTGKTAASWYYTVSRENGAYVISWNNSNLDGGVPVAVIIQTGHGTKNGGYVRGRDYINPAMGPVFDAIANSAWKEMTK